MARSRVSWPEPVKSAFGFPWWGWLGAVLTMCSWVLAWNRFPWFAALQPHTFTPLWLGYILLVNGWTFRRTGHCLMLDRPRLLLALFPASAAFWWSFEYLNRFVQNWYYVGPQILTPWQYVLHATVPFSTVLPAVLSTMELLASVPGVTAGMDRLPTLRWPKPQWAGWALVMFASAGLIGIGTWPQALFPIVWVAPLLLITALQILQRERDNLLAAHTGGRDLIVARGRRGAGLRLVVGDVELQEPGSLGVCHPFRASLPTLRDAITRVCRLPAVRPRMSGCDPMAVPEPLSGHDTVSFEERALGSRRRASF